MIVNKKVICYYNSMMYLFMKLNDETEIVHSDMKEDGTVKVYIETPDEKDGFHNMTYYLPTYEVKMSMDILTNRLKNLLRL